MRTSLLRTNLWTNPNFETGITGIAPARGSLTTDFTKAYIGTGSAKYVADGTAGGNYLSNAASKTPVTAGQTITLSVSILRDSTISKWSLRFYWYDSTNTLISSVTTAPYNDVSDSSWTRVGLTATAPANTASVMFYFIGENTLTSGTTAWFDAVMIEVSASVGEFFDGNTPETFTTFNKWTGTKNASTSEQYRIEIPEGYTIAKGIADAKRQTFENVLGPSPTLDRSFGGFNDVRNAGLEKVLTDNGLI